VIRFVGVACPFYDFSETDEEHSFAPHLPDGSPFTGALSDSTLLFNVTANLGGQQLRSATYVLTPSNAEEQIPFARLRDCVAALNPDRKVFCTQCGASIAMTEPSCTRCGATQFSIESISADLKNLESRLELQVAKLSAAQGVVQTSTSFDAAVNQILSRPLILMPDRPSPLRHILHKNRIWTTRECMSDKEFEALAQDDLDRKLARKRSAVERHMESAPRGVQRPMDGDADPSYQTAPLTDYRASLQRQSEALFNEVKKSVRGRAKRYDGSYSILSRASGATAAKIVIYQPGVGHENGVVPFPKEGVYVLVRTSEKVGQAIWKSSIVQSLGFSERLDPDSTVGIAPMHGRRFACFEVTDKQEHGRIAELLARCSNC